MARIIYLRSVDSGNFKPTQVLNLRTTNISPTEVDLAWDAVVGATFYTVRRSLVGGILSPLPATTGTNYGDVGLTPSTAYIYTVAAINDYGEGPPSVAITATTQPNIVPPPGPQIGVGKQYPTFTAFFAAALTGTTGLAFSGTYNEGIITQRDGVSIDAYPGETPVITGSIANQGNQASFHCLNKNITIGSGITFQGRNPTGSTADYIAGRTLNPLRGIIARGNNFKCSAKVVQYEQDWLLCPLSQAIDRLWYSNMVVDVSGTINDGGNPIADASDGFGMFSNPLTHLVTNPRIDGCYFTRGGHSVAQVAADNALIRRVLVDQSKWQTTFGAGFGQKAMDLYCYRGVVEDSIFMNPGRQADQPTTSCLINYSQNCTTKTTFVLGSINQQGMIGLGTNTFKQPGCSDVRYANCTVYGFTSQGLSIGDLKQTPTFAYGPFYFKNCLFVNNAYNPIPSGPGSQPRSAVISIEYQSAVRGSNGWLNNFFMDTCGFDTNVMVIVIDTSQVEPTIYQPISYFAANYPNNFKNIKIGAPSFVSTAQPTSTNPDTAFVQCKANFTPQNSLFIGTGTALTTTSIGTTNSTVIHLVDAKWFRDPIGWSDLQGDQIYIAGVGTRRIVSISNNDVTVDSAVTVGAGANIFLGSSATPNIGAVVNSNNPTDPIPADAIYVSPSGSDTNPGTQASPKKTLAAAKTAVAVGGTIAMLDGTYPDSIGNTGLKQGTSWIAGGFTRIRAVNTGSVVISGSLGIHVNTHFYCTLEGLCWDYAGNKEVTCHDVKVLNCGFRGGPASGNNETLYCGTNDFTPGASNLLFENCYVYGAGGRYKMMVYRGQGVIFRNCLVRNTGGWTYDGSDPQADITIYDSKNCEAQNCITIDCVTGLTNYLYNFFTVTNTSVNSPGGTFWRNCIVANTSSGGSAAGMGCEGTAGTASANWINCAVINAKTFGFASNELNAASGSVSRCSIDGQNTSSGLSNFNSAHKAITADHCYVTNFSSAIGSNLTTSNMYSFGNGTNTGTVMSPAAAGQANGFELVPGGVLATNGVGADIRFRIGVAGTLYGDTGYADQTSVPMFPWNNEALIKAKFAADNNIGWAASPLSLHDYIASL